MHSPNVPRMSWRREKLANSCRKIDSATDGESLVSLISRISGPLSYKSPRPITTSMLYGMYLARAKNIIGSQETKLHARRLETVAEHLRDRFLEPFHLIPSESEVVLAIMPVANITMHGRKIWDKEGSPLK